MTQRFDPYPSKRIWPARGSSEGVASDGRVLRRWETPFETARLPVAFRMHAFQKSCRVPRVQFPAIGHPVNGYIRKMDLQASAGKRPEPDK